MPRLRLAVLASAAVVASSAAADTVQVTDSAADSALERLAVVGPGRWAAVRSTGDLTPGDPGNADGNAEIWRLDLFTGGLLQATAAGGTVRCPRATVRGNLILSAQEDLTPGAPGNGDGSYESWLFDAGERTLRQISASPEDTFFQTARPDGPRALLGSKGDLVPGGNPDGSYEVFSYDLDTGSLLQLTSTPTTSLIRGLCGVGVDCGIVESFGDLVPASRGGPGNADGSREVYLVDVASGASQQLTASDVESRFAGTNPDGRFVAIESRGDLVPAALGGPGNADGSLEVFVWGVHPNRLIQATASSGDSRFAGFVPKSRFVAFTSREDVVAGGNTDGSQEVFLADLKKPSRVRQLTASAGDTELVLVGDAPRRWAVLRATGDLRPDVAGGGTGSADVYVQRIRRRASKAQRLTSGDAAAGVGGFGPRSARLVIDTTADVVAGGNTDGSREVFIVRFTATRAVPRQLTSTAFDSEAAAVSPGFPVVVIESRGDLDPAASGGLGNADASAEVFLHRYGRLPRRR